MHVCGLVTSTVVCHALFAANMPVRLASSCCCRFDLMWLLLDETDEQNDARLAAHIINVHQGRVGAAAAAGNSGQQDGASTSGGVSHSPLCAMGFCAG